jgi:nucleoid-associated protein YgaU
MRTVTVTGGTLYQLALQQLGDATQWNRIAQANANQAGGPPLDPILVGIVTLNIPAVNPKATGGILVV